MRVRIVKPMAGILGGQSLGRFIPGLIYDVEKNFALQLIALGGAKADDSTEPALVIKVDEKTGIDEAQLTGGVLVIPPDSADERPKHRGRVRKRR